MQYSRMKSSQIMNPNLAPEEFPSPPDEVCCWPGVPSGRNLLAKAHKNPDFVLEMPENEGFGGQKRTKTSILCSEGAKTREISPFLTQKSPFCARNARKWGSRRQKAHKNHDFVLGRSAESGTLPRGIWCWVASARHQAPRRCCRNGGAEA